MAYQEWLMERHHFIKMNMEKIFTETQKEMLRMLKNMSNGISNCVYMAENNESSNVDEKIDTAIWFAKHHIDELENIKKRIAEKEIK